MGAGAESTVNPSHDSRYSLLSTEADTIFVTSAAEIAGVGNGFCRKDAIQPATMAMPQQNAQDDDTNSR